jgi:hypothetical protein
MVRRDLGDFQTPSALVAEVLDALGPVGSRWPRVLEPACGHGSFLMGLIGLADPPREVIGVEIQEAYCEAARMATGASVHTHVRIVQSSLFDLDLRRDLAWHERGALLVVGNPPWVTNAELGSLGSGNHPRKTNVKNLRGIDAKTGASNFDIAEAVWLKLIAELADEETTIALLCKTSVARNVVQFAKQMGLPVVEASLARIDARRWFGATVDACLFRVTFGPGPRVDRVPVFADLNAAVPESVMGFAAGRLVADLDAYQPRAFADGLCPLIWRQGLKHDAATVMELERDGGSDTRRNRLGAPVDVEAESVYPLLKGADLLGPPGAPVRSVIVTQRRIGEDTRGLEWSAPRLWSYLQAHASAFAKRRSSIYRGQPPFAMFGVGPYSFAPYKVAISGLGKTPRFRAIGPEDGRPVMLDDTCYFVACRTPEQTAMLAALLNDPETLGLVGSLIFRDAKRPITKAVLQRIDLGALAARVDQRALIARAEEILSRLQLLATEVTESTER